MSDTNTEIWDKLRRVPPEHLKGFQRAGGFRGTAIKPMWSIHRMTEVFGPCGQAWGMDSPEFQTVPAGDELMVFCTVSVWTENQVNGGRVYGVGGDKVLAKGRDGLRSDDEAFKKAYTDAVTNALKHIGVGADVHMGLWDGNKYIDEAPEPKPEMAAVGGTTGASKAPSRPEYEKMVLAIRNAPTLKAIDDWYKANVSAIEAMPPDFVDELRIEFTDRKSELKKALAA